MTARKTGTRAGAAGKNRDGDGGEAAGRRGSKITRDQEIRERALEALAKLGGQAVADDDVAFEGKRFVLPESMRGNLDNAIKSLTDKRDEEEKEFAFSRVFTFRPRDGAVATGRALRRAFGFTRGKPIQTFFGERPPVLIDVEVGLGEHEQAPWGALTVPGLEGLTLYLGSTLDPEYGQVFALSAEGPRKYRFHVEGLFNLVQAELEERSVYRGQAIDGQEVPKFLDLTGVDESSVVYTRSVLSQLEANVWSPIVHAEQLAELRQPGKRAVLFEGPYGTGKTLAAYLTAQKAVVHGWTFLMCRPGRDDLATVMQTARMYQPACVFFEDLDTVGSPTDGGGDHMSRMLDLFDGLDSKGLRLLLVMTTNRVECLHPGLLRPGRLDAVVSVGALDRPGIEQLTRLVLRDALGDDVDFDQVAKAVNGYMPAFVKEALDRTIRYSVVRNAGQLGQITTDDLIEAAEGLRAQFELMHGASAEPPDTGLPGALGVLVETAAARVIGGSTVVDASDGEVMYQLKPGNGR